MTSREDLRGAVARGWTHPATESRVMDAELAEAIVAEVWDMLYPPNLGCATTAELLAELVARAEVGGYAGYRTVDPA